jgi:hypothetical protein
MACTKCQQSRFGCGGQGCAQTFTGGFLDGLAVKAGDAGATRVMKELGMFALLTSPAWIALLLLPKPKR